MVQLEVLHLASMLCFVMLVFSLEEGELIAKFADIGPRLFDLLFLFEVFLSIRDLQFTVNLTANHLQFLRCESLKVKPPDESVKFVILFCSVLFIYC